MGWSWNVISELSSIQDLGRRDTSGRVWCVPVDEQGSGKPVTVERAITVQVVSYQTFGAFNCDLSSLVRHWVLGGADSLLYAPSIAEILHFFRDEYRGTIR